jgi:Protein of unknown function (DUF3499)
MMTGPKWAPRHGAAQLRACARAGCSEPTVATLRFQSTRREAWLVEVDDDATRTEGDLCAQHAGTLVLPRGWRLYDERTPIHLVEPADATGPDYADGDPTPAEHLATLLDARTPLLQRAFESAKATRPGA